MVADLERTCDYLILLSGSRVQLAGECHELIAEHYRISGARQEASELPGGVEIVQEHHADRQSTFIVRSAVPLPGGDWQVEHLALEDLVLAYMARDQHRPGSSGNPPGEGRPSGATGTTGTTGTTGATQDSQDDSQNLEAHR